MRWKVGVSSGSRAIMRSLARAGEDAIIEDILSLFGEFYEGDFCPAEYIPWSDTPVTIAVGSSVATTVWSAVCPLI